MDPQLSKNDFNFWLTIGLSISNSYTKDMLLIELNKEVVMI